MTVFKAGTTFAEDERGMTGLHGPAAVWGKTRFEDQRGGNNTQRQNQRRGRPAFYRFWEGGGTERERKKTVTTKEKKDSSRKQKASDFWERAPVGGKGLQEGRKKEVREGVHRKSP